MKELKNFTTHPSWRIKLRKVNEEMKEINYQLSIINYKVTFISDRRRTSSSLSSQSRRQGPRDKGQTKITKETKRMMLSFRAKSRNLNDKNESSPLRSR